MKQGEQGYDNIMDYLLSYSGKRERLCYFLKKGGQGLKNPGV
jgi:hypothetical protein